MTSDPRAEAFQSLSRLLVSECSLRATLQRIAELATSAVPTSRMAGITMLDERGRVSTSVFTDAEVPNVDRAQYEAGVGPCLDAWHTQRVVRVDDLMAELGGTYHHFAASAVQHGIRSTLSMPLAVGQQALGALNWYAPRSGAFETDDEAVAADLATAAAVVLSNAAAYWQAYDLSENLKVAMQSRAVIEQAKGFLMSQTPGLDADAAFEILRHASQRENVKLSRIAQRIVNRERPDDAAH